jgi:uncharacterized membrane protein YqiK
MAEIQKFDLPTATACEIAEEGRFRELSACGYRLIAIVPVDRIVPISDSGTNEHGQYFNKTRQERVTDAKYVMALDAESAIAKTQAALAAATSRALTAEQRATVLEDETKKLRVDLAKAQEEVKRNCGIAEALREGGKAEADRRRKMEADIGKVRNAVGDIRMKEILGS